MGRLIATKKLAELYASNGLEVMNNEGIVFHYINPWEKSLEREIREESLQVRKVLVKQALDDYRDNSADAIADFYQVSRNLARSLCKGMKRGNIKTHKGNDYDFRK